MSNKTTALQDLDTQVNTLTLAGKILDALDLHYSDDCSFQEGNEAPIEGKATQRARLSELFASLERFNGATLHSQTIGDGVTMTEWTFDMTGGNGESMVWNEVLVRRWQDNKIVSERFYQA